ncbi:tRNA-specific adenosine deaminase subunit TAD2 [Tolypocladium paradoxum]|uniref:tRNA-specific adenosine deaminase subunit TAD2 n=1 Tax=Tolypocladium paradoxum TaxID=94208 RepID=A0A2S4L4B5_9HYPO|nr:tRNA-specific adenosine deaminase subunit TAD2 [Tolypocladium paradoxum]
MLEDTTNKKFPPTDELYTEETSEFLKKILKKTNVKYSPPLTNAYIINMLVGEFLESRYISSTYGRTAPSLSIESRRPNEGNEDNNKGYLFPYSILKESILYFGIYKVYFSAINDKFSGTGGVISLPNNSDTLGILYLPGGYNSGNIKRGYEIEGS